MRLVKALAMVIALLGFGVRVNAQEEVVHKHGSAGSAVLRDTISGGLLGAAVSGGIIGWEMGVQNHSGYDWQRTLGIGVGIGLGVGLIWGIVDATTGNYAMGTPIAARDGLSETLDVRRQDQSNRVEVPLMAGHF